MINRKILYGYQIQNGEIAVVEDEALVVQRVFSLYLGGQSYQRISDTLNGEKIPFCREAPVWNKHKVKRLLENPRYVGRDGYPPILEDGVFRETQSRIQGKTAGYAPRAERPALRLKEHLRCAGCGASLHRLGGKNRRADTLYLKCGGCGAVVTIPDDALLEEIARQVTEHSTPGPATYQPSGEVIRLTNAINRALESPNKPEEALSLILKGASARYDCCPPAPPTQEEARLLAVDQDHIRQVVSYITISAENVVAVAFR
ncbi:recombinase [Pseudoflavonifractor capillosus ATCC 29799]|uniref:Recombinase n=1 Tax=Pseudoflavonifractor capillosus ATCC 29799 TaxID=411467 RepID=A6NUG9_9FIRM|nr:recombinase family protein [Pseudoflavonifractor capillosus]EDN00516.1 recombinase [Pseudoflavonifractor capillosus ATCC 29799]